MHANRSYLRLRTSEFDHVARLLLGETTDEGIAARLGIDRSRLSELRNGRREPSTKFIAACQQLMPGVPFERLFEVIYGRAEGATT